MHTILFILIVSKPYAMVAMLGFRIVPFCPDIYGRKIWQSKNKPRSKTEGNLAFYSVLIIVRK